MQAPQSVDVTIIESKGKRSGFAQYISEALDAVGQGGAPAPQQRPANPNSWKDPVAKGYDPFKAADALAAIAQPLAWQSDPSREPYFVKDWTSPTGQQFRRGDKAPKWTENEVAAALLPEFKKWAKRQQGKYSGYGDNPSALMSKSEEAHGNMALELIRIMRANIDQGRDTANGYLGFIKARVMGAGNHGVGETNEDRTARGVASKLLTFKKPADAQKAQAIADAVGPQFRNPNGPNKHEKSPSNPYGKWSAHLAQVAETLSHALASGSDPSPVYAQIEDLYNQMSEDPQTFGPGTSIGQVNVPHMGGKEGAAKADRKSLLNMKQASMDGGKENEEGKKSKVEPSDYRAGMSNYLSRINPEVVYNVLKMAREHAIPDMGENEQTAIKSFMKKLPPAFAARNPGLIPLSNLEYRYLLRILSDRLPKGKDGSVKYPGKGHPGEDPELVDQTNKSFDDPKAQPSQWAKEGNPWLAMGKYYVTYDRAAGHFVKHPINDPEDVRKALGVRDGQAHVDVQIAHSLGVSVNRVNQIAKGKGDGPGALEKFGAWLKYYEEMTDEAAVENRIDKLDLQIIKESIEGLRKIYNKRFDVRVLFS